MMSTKKDLIKWLKDIDTKLDKSITLIAVGGTAMTLLNLKESTKDIDFCIDSKDYNRFKRLVKDSKFKVDIFTDGHIFSEQLPDDYIDISSEYKEADFENIKLRILDPLDIIITKAARYNERDEEDIAALAKAVDVDKSKLIRRFKEVLETYAGSEKDFEYHFEIILERHFKLRNRRFPSR